MNTHVSDIEAREKAATPGKWLAAEGQAGSIVVAENPQVATVLVAVISSSGKRGQADAAFAANAKHDIQYLLAQLREGDETIEVMRPLLRRLRDRIEEPTDPTCCPTCEESANDLVEIDRILEGGE